MTKKRVIKLLMSRGYSRNRAREFQHIRSGKFTNEGILPIDNACEKQAKSKNIRNRRTKKAGAVKPLFFAFNSLFSTFA